MDAATRKRRGAKKPDGAFQRRGVLVAIALVLASIGVIGFVALNREGQSVGEGQDTPGKQEAAAAKLEGEKTPEIGSFLPGTYKTDEFEPAFSYEFASTDRRDRLRASTELLDYFAVGPAWFPFDNSDYELEPRIAFVSPNEVYPYSRNASEFDPAPQDMATWIREHPSLRIDQEEPVNVGGVPGTWFYGTVEPNGDVPLFRVSSGIDVFLPGGHEFRLVALNDVAGEAVVINIEGTEKQLETGFQGEKANLKAPLDGPFLSRAKEMLASVEFAASGTAPTTGAPPVTDISAETSSTEGKTIPGLVGDNTPSLPAGRYATDWFTPALAFEVGEGWATTGEYMGSFELLPQTEASNFDPPQYSSLGVNRIDSVYNPENQGDMPMNPTKHEDFLSPLPDDIITWLQKHPHLKTSKPESVTVGGLQGTRIDAEVLPIKDYSDVCDPNKPCILIARANEDNGMLLFPAGGKSRLILLEDVEGETVLVSSNAYPASEFDSIVQKAQKVIDTVEWEGS